MHQIRPISRYSRFRCHNRIDPDISNQTLFPQYFQERFRPSRAIPRFLSIHKL